MKQHLIERFQQLAGIKPLYTLKESTEFPSWLEDKLKQVHGGPGQGSYFNKHLVGGTNILLKGIIEKEISKLTPENLNTIANGEGTYTFNHPMAGYDLVVPIEQAEELGKKVADIEKEEGPNKIKVPAYEISIDTLMSSNSGLETNEITVVIRPKKDDSGKVLEGEYIILSAFPGKDLPRASEWGGKYAVLIPSQEQKVDFGKKYPETSFEKDLTL